MTKFSLQQASNRDEHGSSFTPASSSFDVSLADKCLPAAAVSQTQIDQAKVLLERERCGITYRQVLETIAAEPWRFPFCTEVHDIRVTKQLIKCDAALHKKYLDALRSEGIVSRALALVGHQRRPSTHENFLAEVRQVNQILAELTQAELVKIERRPPVYLDVSTPPNPIYLLVLDNDVTFTVSNLGKLALRA